jgi:hypothetical protein
MLKSQRGRGSGIGFDSAAAAVVVVVVVVGVAAADDDGGCHQGGVDVEDDVEVDCVHVAPSSFSVSCPT